MERLRDRWPAATDSRYRHGGQPLSHAHLHDRPDGAGRAVGRSIGPSSRWSRCRDGRTLEVLRIAALDLSGEIPLETVGASLSDLADGLLGAATTTSGLAAELAVIAMGKLGARELNYGSDIDVVLVGGGDPQPLVGLVRQAWRTDLGLRPEGRSGPLVRSLASYLVYWDRWAQTWEFQALLKCRPAAGDPELGSCLRRSRRLQRVWGRPLGADDLRAAAGHEGSGRACGGTPGPLSDVR